jgi:ketosteroid isomerase-like protein
MKTILLVTFLLTMGRVQPDERRQVIRLEQQLSDALVRLDFKTVDDLWNDDLVFISPTGQVTTKAQRLTGMKTPVQPADAVVAASTNDDIQVRLYGQTAVVTLLSTWKGKGSDNREFSTRYMTTHVWAKQSGRWRLVSAHVSRLARSP